MNFIIPILLFISLPSLSFGIHINSDYASYKTDNDSVVYVDIFYAIERSELPFKEDTSGRLLSNFTLSIVLQKLDNTIVDSASFPLAVAISNKNELNQPYYIYDAINLFLHPGIYIYKLNLQFEKPEYNATFIDTMTITPFAPDMISISDIIFISSLTDATEPGKFVRYGKKILPNPSRIYSDEMPVAYFIVEIYRPVVDKSEIFDKSGGFDKSRVFDKSRAFDKSNAYGAILTITNSKGKTIRTFNLDTLNWTDNRSVLINGFSVAGFPEDEYVMSIRITNGENVVAEKTKSFYVVKRLAKRASDDEMLEVERQKISFFATKNELALFDKLDNDGKKEFIVSFWGKRGEGMKKAIDERFAYANTRFSTSKAKKPDGWKTDQGRIYIVYGPPDNIERHDMTIESSQWEKWEYYHIDKGIFFIFADVYGTGEMVLVHSNAKGELQDENWMRRITRMPSTLPGER